MIGTKRKDLEIIEQELLTRKSELEQELQMLYAEKSSDDQVQDPGDQAMSAIFENLKSSLETKEYEEYRMIMQALEKIKVGDYGLCADCGQAISEKRLKLYPNVSRCLLCQEALEEKTGNQ